MRHDEVACQRRVDIDVQQATRLSAGERPFRVLKVRDQPEAAPVVDLAVKCGADVASGPLQQSRPESRLQLLDGVRHRGARQVKIGRRPREAPALHDATEGPHGVEAVHCSPRRMLPDYA